MRLFIIKLTSALLTPNSLAISTPLVVADIALIASTPSGANCFLAGTRLSGVVYFHVLPVTIFRMVLGVVLYSLASMTVLPYPSNGYRSRIAPTCSGFSVVLPILSPRAERPLLTMSSELSDAVPEKRCSGNTHNDTSQVWQAYLLPRSIPNAMKYEILLALYWLPLSVSRGLPHPKVPPAHIQQWDVFNTFFQNLSISLALSGGMGLQLRVAIGLFSQIIGQWRGGVPGCCAANK